MELKREYAFLAVPYPKVVHDYHVEVPDNVSCCLMSGSISSRRRGGKDLGSPIVQKYNFN